MAELAAAKETVAPSLLRGELEGKRAQAALLETRANETWGDYVRYSNSAREAWRELNELVEAIARLESDHA